MVEAGPVFAWKWKISYGGGVTGGCEEYGCKDDGLGWAQAIGAVAGGRADSLALIAYLHRGDATVGRLLLASTAAAVAVRRPITVRQRRIASHAHQRLAAEIRLEINGSDSAIASGRPQRRNEIRDCELPIRNDASAAKASPSPSRK